MLDGIILAFGTTVRSLLNTFRMNWIMNLNKMNYEL